MRGKRISERSTDATPFRDNMPRGEGVVQFSKIKRVIMVVVMVGLMVILLVEVILAL